MNEYKLYKIDQEININPVSIKSNRVSKEILEQKISLS